MAAWKSGIGRSLFKKPRDDPEFIAAQQKVRLSLLKDLARAIKETQLLHATQGEGQPIGDCRPAERLCARFEGMLRHGLKASWFGSSVSFWPLVLKISRKQAISYISSLQYAQSDLGRCRAWIRMAVNECSLESYLSVVSQDTDLCTQYYESYAFVRDEESAGAMRQLLAGLSHITFSITVDTASLEVEAAPEVVQPVNRLRMVQGAGLGEKKKRGRKREKGGGATERVLHEHSME